ncbi:transporter family-2 protein [Anaerosolibacter carboniphilus]|uniref:Transporter family-2 protein n=1 Tax=Anaerosolibacter carboniphilus TaxID=1417629 RepID=A0A841KX93_9FIRM|nr:DMT family transporter [Anaerosolibacter carboniphilus]MBB6217983.1 transporter family-2 protein [Anaerosolibacter carboniphilus]
MKDLLPILFAISAGIFTALETSINAKLGNIVTPIIATLHSLITGALIILIANLLKGSLSQYAQVIHVRPHLLIGGIFGTFIIYLVTKTMPKLGVATTLTIVVASEIICGLLIDAFITKQHEFDWLKLIGVILLLCGTFFIARK